MGIDFGRLRAKAAAERARQDLEAGPWGQEVLKSGITIYARRTRSGRPIAAVGYIGGGSYAARVAGPDGSAAVGYIHTDSWGSALVDTDKTLLNLGWTLPVSEEPGGG